MLKQFDAVVVREQDGAVSYSVEVVTDEQLSPGEVIIKVAYSSINYKDMLAVKANGGVIRNYPMIPGIDLSGTVISSETSDLQAGQKVLVTGFQMGMGHTGGLSEYARVPAEWIVPLPDGLSLRDAMIVGTAGFTAGLSIMALEKMGMNMRNNPNILVTGASGGVGSIAIQLLHKCGYTNIAALSRKSAEEARLKSIGATYIVTPNDIFPDKPKPLVKQKFHYVLDTVGGDVASALIPQIHYGGSMSMCGNAGGIKLDTTVLPFILRGVNVLGVDSVNFPIAERFSIWSRFAGEWHIMDDALVSEIDMGELKQTFEALNNGTHTGRTIVKIS